MNNIIKRTVTVMLTLFIMAALFTTPAFAYTSVDTTLQSAVLNLQGKGQPGVTDGLSIAALVDTGTIAAGDEICNNYILSVNEALQTGSPTLYTADAVIGVTAAGMSAAALQDGILLKALADECAATNQPILLAEDLLALASGKYDFPQDSGITAQQAVSKLLATQNEDGGFGLGGASNMNTTAKALMALAYYKGYAGVTEAVNNGGAYLVQRQNDTGSFPAEQNDEVLLTANAIMGFSLNGFDAGALTAEGPDAVAYLVSAQNGDGGFGAYIGAGSDKNVTVRAILACVAYKQKSTLTFDFSENLSQSLPQTHPEDLSDTMSQPIVSEPQEISAERQVISLSTVIWVFVGIGFLGALVAVLLKRLANRRSR